MKNSNLPYIDIEGKDFILRCSSSFQVKDNSQQELEMWFVVALVLKKIPNDHRSQNHTAFYNEVQMRVYDLVDLLHLNQSDWKVE